MYQHIPFRRHRLIEPHTAPPATSRAKTPLPDPAENELKSASLINNWLYNTGASDHTTPTFLELEQKYEDGNSLVEK
jgi:hypothetical protein